MNGISWANIGVNKDTRKNRRAPVTPGVIKQKIHNKGKPKCSKRLYALIVIRY
uniref:Uncharacterized protein n=1 Tax=uncultured Desulfobacterium sp. TaxID=201089 RepID=E1YKC2_9BACT|nr:unknown protein [uncultured Desulfobacterium sp.]